MVDFFASIGSLFGLISWSDWVIIAIMIGFLILGYKRGLARELINFGFFIATILVSWIFYQALADSTVITWLLLSQQSHLTIAFSIIFVGVLLVKKAIYRIIDASTSIDTPCSLNIIFTRIVIISVALLLSWQYLNTVSQIDFIKYVITNDSLRVNLSFVVIFGLIIGTFFALSKILNISIDSDKPCLLAPIFERILNALHAADNLLNARNINSSQNNIFGSIVGLIKGFVFMIMLVLILQSVGWASQQYFWIETDGALRLLQDIATSIKPTLSNYFLFIEVEI
ncbi:MAG: CvpA family protein [PS1 clade bacterium]